MRTFARRVFRSRYQRDLLYSDLQSREWLPGGDIPEQALAGGQSGKLSLHVIHSIEITPGTVVPAPLTRGRPKAACSISVARTGPTEMNHGGHVLFLLERGTGASRLSDCAYHCTVEQSCRQLDGMVRQDAAVEAVEPAGV